MPPSAPFLSNPCGHRGCGKMTTESVAHTGPWVVRSELRRGGSRLPAATPSPGARTRRRSQKPGSRGGAGSASPRVTPMPRARQPGGDQGALSGTRPGRIPSRSLSGSHFCFQPGSSRRAELTEPPRARGEGRVRSVTVQSRRPFAGDGSSSRPVCGQPWSRPPPLPTPRARRRCPGKRCGRSSHCRGGGRPARPAEALPPVSGRPDPEPGNCLASSPGHSLGRSVASGLTQHCLWPPARARATCEDRRPVLHSEGDPGGWADQELDRCSGSHAAAAPPWGDVARESRLGASPPAASAVWPEALEPPIPQLRRVLASGIIPKCLLLRWG